MAGQHVAEALGDCQFGPRVVAPCESLTNDHGRNAMLRDMPHIVQSWLEFCVAERKVDSLRVLGLKLHDHVLEQQPQLRRHYTATSSTTTKPVPSSVSPPPARVPLRRRAAPPPSIPLPPRAPADEYFESSSSSEDDEADLYTVSSAAPAAAAAADEYDSDNSDDSHATHGTHFSALTALSRVSRRSTGSTLSRASQHSASSTASAFSLASGRSTRSAASLLLTEPQQQHVEPVKSNPFKLPLPELPSPAGVPTGRAVTFTASASATPTVAPVATQQQCSATCADGVTQCSRKATTECNGLHFCTQHGNAAKSRLAAEKRAATVAAKKAQ